ncbi:MAG TPA: hypothetical protein PK040_04690, partial [Anaerolineaceae bacterium]|nr:hypothetical protein [Anaerolineaceae bacterium]
AVIMNPNQVNARVVIPVTTYNNITRGFQIDYVLYANNYEAVNDPAKTILPFLSKEEALQVFRQGRSMSKGTTTSTGITEAYFANVFGPSQYQDLHEGLAVRYFGEFIKQGIFVGQMYTQLGVNSREKVGPELAAKALLKLIRKAK